jgi:hypothetical protein
VQHPVNIMPYKSLIPSDRPELAPLVQKVRSLVSSPEVTPSNLDAAIAKASSSFVSATTGTYLKVRTQSPILFYLLFVSFFVYFVLLFCFTFNILLIHFYVLLIYFLFTFLFYFFRLRLC